MNHNTFQPPGHVSRPALAPEAERLAPRPIKLVDGRDGMPLAVLEPRKAHR